jgi:hypothetical protein
VSVRDASKSANNQDALVYALYLLGGADREVHVEDIYIKCFEIAPARLGWRTRPEIPDYKKTSKALQSVEKTELPGLLVKPHALARRLTAQGVEWIERNLPTLESLYGEGVVVAGTLKAEHEPLRREVRASAAWAEFTEHGSANISDIAEALSCSPASPRETWQIRIGGLDRASQVLQDLELARFARMVETTVLGGSN